MKNKHTSKGYGRAKKLTVFLALFFLSCLLFSSCNRNKSDANKNADNAFSDDLSKNKEIDLSNQMLHPCNWSFTVEQDASGEATLISTAKIDSGWHLYSQHISEEGSPTVFTYDTLPDYKLDGRTEEGISHKKLDPYLNIDILYFENEAVFKQKIKVLSSKDFTISGTIENTACLTQCVTFTDNFSFKVKGNSKKK